MRKVKSLIDFVSVIEDLEKRGIGIKSLENILPLLSSDYPEHKGKVFAIPL